jgi:hypothetical protein
LGFDNLPDEHELIEVDLTQGQQFMGDAIRWIKCLFKDCETEDAILDHKAAEQERAEKRTLEAKKHQEQQEAQEHELKVKKDREAKELAEAQQRQAQLEQQ